MTFPKIALRINVPRGMNELVSEVGTDYIKGLEKHFQEEGYTDGPRTFHNIAQNLSLVSQLGGWYEMRDISMAPAIPILKEMEARKHPGYPIRLEGDVHFGEESLKDIFYSDSFRKKHVFPISLYTIMPDEHGEARREDFVDDELKVDFSQLKFMQRNYFPTPRLSNSYELAYSNNGRGLTLEVARKPIDLSNTQE